MADKMAFQFQVGMKVVIKGTDNVLSRFPQLIGQEGVILLTPVHPSTWFTLKLKKDNTQVKLQPTAMRVLEGASKFLDEDENNLVEDTISSPTSSSPLPEKVAGRSRASSLTQYGQDDTMVEGSIVKILATDNVLQRAPHLVGQTGTVIAAPVHPTTWFKVAFEDGAMLTFRPSALAPVNANEADSSSSTVNRKHNTDDKPPNKKQKIGADSTAAEDADGVEEGEPLPVGKRNASQFPDSSTPSTGILLSTLDPDTWEGIMVKIKGGGKYQGLIGKVLRSGNGWVQLDCRSTGEIAKRAYELELMVKPSANAQLATPAPTKRTSQPEGQGSSKSARGNASSPPTEPSREGTNRSAAAKRPRSARNVAEEVTPASTSSRRVGGSGAGMANRSRRGVVVEEEGGGATEEEVEEPPEGRTGSRRSRSSSTDFSASQQTTTSSRSGTSSRGSVGVNTGIAVSKATVDKATTRRQLLQAAPVGRVVSDALVRVSSALIAARRDYTQKYIDRHVEKLNNRPDLRYWQRHIRSVMVDEAFELNTANEVFDSYCNICMMEKVDPNATCWNDKCPQSPIYHKLLERDAKKLKAKHEGAVRDAVSVELVGKTAEEGMEIEPEVKQARESNAKDEQPKEEGSTSADTEAEQEPKVKEHKVSRSEKLKCQEKNLQSYLSSMDYRRTPCSNPIVDALRLPAYLLCVPSGEKIYEVSDKQSKAVVEPELPTPFAAAIAGISPAVAIAKEEVKVAAAVLEVEKEKKEKNESDLEDVKVSSIEQTTNTAVAEQEHEPVVEEGTHAVPNPNPNPNPKRASDVSVVVVPATHDDVAVDMGTAILCEAVPTAENVVY